MKKGKRAPRVSHPAAPSRGTREGETLGKLERELRDELDRGESAQWRAGRAFHAIASSGLYKKYSESLEEYANLRFPEHGYSTLRTYRRVALHFSERTTIKHTMSRLDLGLRYIELTPEDERPMDVPDMDVEVAPGEVKAFAECSVEDLKAAIALRTEGDEKKRALPRGAGKTVNEVTDAFAKSGLDDEDRPTLRTELARKGGRARVLAVVRAPLDKLDVAARAILRALGKR